MNIFHLWHRWSPWTAPVVVHYERPAFVVSDTYMSSASYDTVDFSRMEQSRTCGDCGLVQMREVLVR